MEFPRGMISDRMNRADKPSWQSKQRDPRLDKDMDVIGFYGDKEGKPYREFSNFYRHYRFFEYVLPSFARRQGFPMSCWCDFSEKAIMFTKAVLMGDLKICRAIKESSDPRTCKALGRVIENFDEELWQRRLEEVAFEVVRQKFAAEDSPRNVLLSTGDAILAEAAPNDRIWGIGLSTKDPRVQDPSQWLGRNILGNALMRARRHFRASLIYDAEASDAHVACYGVTEPKPRKAASRALQIRCLRTAPGMEAAERRRDYRGGVATADGAAYL